MTGTSTLRMITIHKLRTGVLWTMFCLSICYVQAQQDSILGKFSLSESNGLVAISWQIVAGSTCNGIQIYRSTDAVNFTRIGYIPGICGSLDEPVNYSFTDTTPVRNAINYYYLEFGGVGASQVIGIEVIDKSQSGYQVRPNPIQNEGTIYFESQIGIDYLLRIYDAMGKEVYSAETTGDHFDIITSDFSPGQYVFIISTSGDAASFKGKFIVQ